MNEYELLIPISVEIDYDDTYNNNDVYNIIEDELNFIIDKYSKTIIKEIKTKLDIDLEFYDIKTENNKKFISANLLYDGDIDELEDKIDNLIKNMEFNYSIDFETDKGLDSVQISLSPYINCEIIDLNTDIEESAMSNYMNIFYKDKIKKESVMTPTPTPYAPESATSEFPESVIVLFDEDKKPILSPRGVIIAAFGSQADLDNYVNNLYLLIKNAKEIYSVIPELYTQAITKLDEKEYYKYIKKNGFLHTPFDEMKAEDKVYDDALDNDPDFDI